MNSFEFPLESGEDGAPPTVDHGFFGERRDQCAGLAALYQRLYLLIRLLALIQTARCSLRSTFWAGTPSARSLQLRTSRFTSKCVEEDCTGSKELTVKSFLPLQLMTYNETPLLVQMHPAATTRSLPLSVFESVVELVDGEPQVAFSSAAYEVETGEAERIAVDHVAKPSTGANEGAQTGSAFQRYKCREHRHAHCQACKPSAQ